MYLMRGKLQCYYEIMTFELPLRIMLHTRICSLFILYLKLYIVKYICNIYKYIYKYI